MRSSNRSNVLAGLAVGVGVGVGAYLTGRTLLNRLRRFDLRDRVVLITGGSRGLGLLLAREFGGRGARVAVCARSPTELQRAQRMLCQEGVGLWIGHCDITQREQVEDLVGRVRKDVGQVDVLVNNAGTIEVGPVETMTLEDYQRAMAINFFGPLMVTSEVLPGMKRQGEGRIVNITSIGGKVSIPHLLPYSASKFAMVGWSEGLRAELKKDNIYVTTVVPGLMRTGSPRNALFKGDHRAEYAWFSIMDSLPFTSMSARRAARRIVSAAANGEAEVTLSIQAKIATSIAAMCPNTTSAVLSWVNRMLPSTDGTGMGARKGKESESGWAPSALTALSDQAAIDNNEMM